MTTSTLHLNNPVPSNGAVVSSLGGRHTVTVTLAGVGAISCVVQAWGSEQGTDSRKIGAPVTVSGTTTVSQTLTFDADCKQFWLELVKLSPACKFNATVENDGSTSLVGPVRAPNILRGGNQVLAIGNSIGEAAYGVAAPTGMAWCQLSGGAANINDIAKPSRRDLRKSYQIQLKCVRAGAIGATEPEWPDVGQEIDDGAARWIVERCASGFSRVAGCWNICMELLGQPLDLIYTVGGPGRRSEFVVEHANKALAECDPGVIFVCDMFSNDVSQLAGDMNLYRAAWGRVAAFLDEQVSAGRYIILQGASPGPFSADALRDGVGYFHGRIVEWALANASSCMLWTGPTEETASLVYGEDWLPDAVTPYIVSNSSDNKITDGIHPLNVAQWRMAKSLAAKIDTLRMPTYQFQDFGSCQRFPNPRNLGTDGVVNAGVTGSAPTGWTVERSGAATGVSSLVRRADGVSGYWWLIAASSLSDGEVFAYRSQSLVAMGFSVGDEIDFFAEIVNADMSPSAYRVRVEISFYNATEYGSFSSLLFTNGQPFGQAMGGDNLVQVAKPIPFKLRVPAGTTDIGVSVFINGSGAWSGTARIGRININNRSM